MKTYEMPEIEIVEMNVVDEITTINPGDDWTSIA